MNLNDYIAPEAPKEPDPVLTLELEQLSLRPMTTSERNKAEAEAHAAHATRKRVREHAAFTAQSEMLDKFRKDVKTELGFDKLPPAAIVILDDIMDEAECLYHHRNHDEYQTHVEEYTGRLQAMYDAMRQQAELLAFFHASLEKPKS